jgi:spoIIIJ-associated protein
MEWIQVTGRTLEDAVEQALDRLGVDESDLEFEIIEEAKSGFLGVGRSDARIRARVRPVSREKPDGRRERRRGGRARTRTEPRPRNRGTTPAPRPEAARQRPTRQEAPAVETETTEITEAELDEQCSAATEFLAGLLDAFDLDGEIHGEVADGTITVAITGEGLGVLIGPRGATLNAIEDVTHSVVQRGASGPSARLRVDVGGYRERRRAALAEFARDLASRATETGETQVLEPMGPADRKVVHDTVAEIDGVETASEGVEPRRRVVIRPS